MWVLVFILSVVCLLDLFFKNIFYLSALGHSCSVWTLSCGMWDLVL